LWNQAWVLKNSPSMENCQNLAIENVHPNREDRLQRILTQSYFDDFWKNDFFNTHRPLPETALSQKWSLKSASCPPVTNGNSLK
jgi:hypothetical protein